MPQTIATSSMCMRARTCRITSTGHGAPPIARCAGSTGRSASKSGSASSAMNIVGTP